MAICPFARIRLLPESETQPLIVPRAVILHSAAGRGSLYGFFKSSSNLESHFWVGEDGTIEQYMDTARRADANLKANGFAVSVETESSPQALERWSPAAATSLVRLIGWLCDTHSIPRRQIPSWDGSGIGWHRMFGAPGPWTPVAKSCPGPARVDQARTEIIPAVAGDTTPPPKGWLMALTDQQQKDLYDAVMRLDKRLTNAGKGESWADRIGEDTNATRAAVGRIERKAKD